MEYIIPQDNELYASYIQRILDVRENAKDENEYQERHHIIPKCMGGSNDKDNLIYLYAQEHYYAHKLLALENPEEEVLQYAWWNMCHITRDYIVSPDEYSEARNRFAKLASIMNSGENSYWWGKKQSEESNQKRSAKLSKEKNPMYGRHHTEEAKKRVSEANKGKRCGKEHHAARRVMCINTQEVFDTATEAAKAYNLKSRSSITLCCKGDTQTAGTHPVTGERLSWKYIDN